MRKINILFKKSIHLSSTFLLLTSTLLPTLPLSTQTSVSADTNPKTLQPGETIDNGMHKWDVTDFTNSSNYTPVGKNTENAGWSGKTTYDFGTFQKNTGSWLPFNGGVDMTQPISITGNTFANAGGIISPGAHLGDANGIILTDLPAAQLSKGTTGPGLGVGTLGENTYFIGNNYSFREQWLPGAYDTATVIAQGGDGASAKILSSSSPYWANNSAKNIFAMDWSNPVLNPNGTVTGEISYKSQDGGVFYTATKMITVQKNMSIGFMAATGGNYSKMSTQIYKVTAGKGSQPVGIHYINSATGQQFSPRHQKWEHSTVIANIGETLSVLMPGRITTSSDYVAPVAPSGYELASISGPITVQNFPDGTKNPNQINVSYAPLAQISSFNYRYSSESKHTPDVPTASHFSGVTDQRLVDAKPTIQNELVTHVPDGYYISKISTNSGTQITGNSTLETLNTFFMSDPIFNDLVNNNNYQVTLSPLLQTGVVSYSYDAATPDTSSKLPVDIPLSGLTGEALSFNIPTLPKGYAVSRVKAPNKKVYPSIETALTENTYYIVPANDFHVTVNALPQIATVNYQWASDVPGQNGVEGILQAKLPAQTSITGVTNGKLNFLATVPKGYAIDSVVAPDGNTYTDATIKGMTALEAAQKKNATFIDGDNSFIITLKALKQKVTLAILVGNTAGETPPNIPEPKVMTTALTGAVIKDSDIKLTQNWLNNWMTDKAAGWSIAAYEDPKGGKYTDAAKQLRQAVVGVGGHVLADNNQYQVDIDYMGALVFSDMPTTIDFGSHTISTTNETYTGKINNSVIVSDTRGKTNISPWQLTLSETSPISEVISTGVDAFGNTNYIPISNGISFANHLSYNGVVLNKEDKLIFSQHTTETRKTTIVDKNKLTPLSLSVPIEFQKSLATFKGKVTWTLSSTP